MTEQIYIKLDGTATPSDMVKNLREIADYIELNEFPAEIEKSANGRAEYVTDGLQWELSEDQDELNAIEE